VGGQRWLAEAAAIAVEAPATQIPPPTQRAAAPGIPSLTAAHGLVRVL
jgi:hypothetical protein